MSEVSGEPCLSEGKRQAVSAEARVVWSRGRWQLSGHELCQCGGIIPHLHPPTGEVTPESSMSSVVGDYSNMLGTVTE